MTSGEIMGVMQESVMVAIKICAPLLIVSMVVGLIISIFQAATSINEQTMTFVPKLLILALTLLALGSWMLESLKDFTIYIFELMMG